MRITFCAFAGWLLTSAMSLAGPPMIGNVSMDIRVPQEDLETTVRSWSESSLEPSWLGWHVPALDADHVLCCRSRRQPAWQEQSCSLEGSHRHFVFTSENPVAALGEGNLVVLMRAVGGRIAEVQVYSENCPLDAGGRPLHWLEEVEPARSASFLGQLVEHNSSVAGEALMALALHDSSVAGDRLSTLARQGPDSDLRGEALFWLAQRGSDDAFSVLLEVARDRSRPSSERQQAFFWYVQSADDEALDLIARILSD